MTLRVFALVLGVYSQYDESTNGPNSGGVLRVRAVPQGSAPLILGVLSGFRGSVYIPRKLPVLAVFCGSVLINTASSGSTSVVGTRVWYRVKTWGVYDIDIYSPKNMTK